jgi:hypothetical protein
MMMISGMAGTPVAVSQIRFSTKDPPELMKRRNFARKTACHSPKFF